MENQGSSKKFYIKLLYFEINCIYSNIHATLTENISKQLSCNLKAHVAKTWKIPLKLPVYSLPMKMHLVALRCNHYFVIYNASFNISLYSFLI